MKRLSALLALGSIVGSAVLPLHGAAAQGGLGDLVGARGSSAESALGNRGYALSGNKGAASMWWNRSSRTCVSMLVDDGRVQSIQPASAGDCGKSGSGGSDAAAAIAGVAAIGLIAALASHHKNGGSNHSGDTHDSEYQRGYNDGLYGGGYDNNDNEPYHEGYMAGDAERRNRVASNSRFVRGAPPAAQNACMRRGDDYLNVPSGSTIPVSVSDYGQGSYEITVASGHYRARCAVDAYGSVSGMNPY